MSLILLVQVLPPPNNLRLELGWPPWRKGRSVDNNSLNRTAESLPRMKRSELQSNCAAAHFLQPTMASGIEMVGCGRMRLKSLYFAALILKQYAGSVGLATQAWLCNCYGIRRQQRSRRRVLRLRHLQPCLS